MSDPVPPADSPALDLRAIVTKWLDSCGPCDAGLASACTHPDEDYRPVVAALVAEVERLRSDLAEALDDLECRRWQVVTMRETLFAVRDQRDRLAAQVQAVEVAMRTTGVEGFVKYEDLEAALGHTVRSDIDDILARSAVPAATEETE